MLTTIVLLSSATETYSVAQHIWNAHERSIILSVVCLKVLWKVEFGVDIAVLGFVT